MIGTKFSNIYTNNFLMPIDAIFCLTSLPYTRTSMVCYEKFTSHSSTQLLSIVSNCEQDFAKVSTYF